MTEPARGGGAVRTGTVLTSLRAALERRAAEVGTERLDIVDAGGGTGGVAVPLARLGHRVTVIDPSPDSLAALERRATDAGVATLIFAVQGDAANLLDIVPAASSDAVLCHSVLEVLDDPAAAVRAAAGALRPGGIASLLVANRAAVVVHRAASGRFDEALHALRDPNGRYGSADPAPRRYALDEIEELIGAVGLEVISSAGVRVFADLVPGAVLDAEPMALTRLLELEAAASSIPAFRGIATQLHVLGRRRQ